MKRWMLSLAATMMLAAPLSGCDPEVEDDGEVDLCSDDLDCDDGFICEITDEDDGICVEDI